VSSKNKLWNLKNYEILTTNSLYSELSSRR